MGGRRMAKIELKNIYKKYDNSDHYTVKDINFEIDEKEFLVLVGPSGCGKSTMLRMIAGLEDISDGELIINGKKVNDVEPKNRDIAMVFQNYALYPHMTVFDNIAFGLKIKKVPKKEIAEKVQEAAEILGLSELLNRKPKELSGGQRQRVALGRAIVKQSSICLMDEPLSNLDAKLRVQMRAEITKLHRKMNTTTIYVTHDQTEAMTMASRIVILKDGIIQQIGSPKDVYRKPNNKFVASFIGSPGMNFLEGKLKGNQFIVSEGKATYTFTEKEQKQIEANANRDVILGIRPENISISDEKTPFQVTVDLVEVVGAEMFVHTKYEDHTIVIKAATDDSLEVGSTIHLNFEEDTLHLFDKENENRLEI